MFRPTFVRVRPPCNSEYSQELSLCRDQLFTTGRSAQRHVLSRTSAAHLHKYWCCRSKSQLRTAGRGSSSEAARENHWGKQRAKEGKEGGDFPLPKKELLCKIKFQSFYHFFLAKPNQGVTKPQTRCSRSAASTEAPAGRVTQDSSGLGAAWSCGVGMTARGEKLPGTTQGTPPVPSRACCRLQPRPCCRSRRDREGTATARQPRPPWAAHGEDAIQLLRATCV